MNRLKDLFERTNIWFNSLTDEEWRDFNYFIAMTCGILIIMTWIRTQIQKNITSKKEQVTFTLQMTWKKV